MLPGPLQVGDLLAERYRLLDRVPSESTALLWRAHDEVLARDVAVRVLVATDREGRELVQPFLQAAGRAGQLSHPGLARVFDAAVLPGTKRGTTVAYLIREWVEGEPLDEHLLRVGELAGPDAADLLRQVADALGAAHASGLAHGRLHPGNVLVGSTGRVRLTDAGVSAALHATAVSEPAADDELAADTRDVGALLFALLTAHWPARSSPQPAGALPAAPRAQRQELGPHQLRAAVSRQLDHVVMRALAPQRVPTLPPLRTPAAVADAADAATQAERRERQLAAVPREPGWARRHLGVLVSLAVVGSLAATGWYAGLAVGKLERRPDAVDLDASPAPGPSGASPAPTLDLRSVRVRDFDPLGDQQENPDQVRNAIDGEIPTAWLTQRYRTAAFSGLKPGVGLLVDLGSVRAVRRVQVALTAPGAALELRTAAALPASLDDTRAVAEEDSAGVVASLVPSAGTRSRYVLVWLTGLPKDEDGGYRVGISEIAIG